MSKMKKLPSKKSYSWWWDSHISPKNSKWLEENLEEMDKLVKQMLRLIDEEGDSFAKKAEMYYQRRPELIFHVEEFYRMYRSLAERYDNVTGELRKNMPLKKRSSVSNGGSLPPIRSPDRTPDKKHSKAKEGHRAAGFEVFLGSGGSSDISKKGSGSSSSSSSDSDSDSDDTKEGSLHFDDVQHQRISELESELEELRQRLTDYEGDSNVSHDHLGNGSSEDYQSRLQELEMELTNTIGRLNVSEEEIKRLQQELEIKIQAQNDCSNVIQNLSLRVSELETELTSANARLQTSEEEVKKLLNDLEMKGLSDNAEREQISILEEKITVLETEVKRLQEELETKIQEQIDSSNLIQNLSLRVSELEVELTSADTRCQASEEEVKSLRNDLAMKGLSDNAEREQISELERTITILEEDIKRLQQELEGKIRAQNDSDTVIQELSLRVSELELELTSTKERLRTSEEDMKKVRDDLKIEVLSDYDLKREQVSVLEQKITNMETEIMCYHNKCEEMETGFSTSLKQLRDDISERDVTIEGLKVECSAMYEKHQQEKLQLENEIADRDGTIEQLRDELRKFSQDKLALESKLSEMEHEVCELKERITLSNEKILQENQQLESQITSLLDSQSSLTQRLESLDGVRRQLETEKEEVLAVSTQQVSDMERKLDELKTKLGVLTSEKVELNERVSVLLLEIKSRDSNISDMDAHLHQLHMEHMKLIKEAQETNKVNEDLNVRVKALEEEVERQRVVISDSAEGKREAIRQLCFSLEHYRLGYQELRQALIGHRRTQAQTVLAS